MLPPENNNGKPVTLSSGSFWRRQRPSEPSPREVSPLYAPVSIQEVIASLHPPVAPSLARAKTLCEMLERYNGIDLITPEMLEPIWTSFCSNESPPLIQASGFRIVTAFWNHATSSSDQYAVQRHLIFRFMQQDTHMWFREIWEARFEALKAITSGGTAVEGIEVDCLSLLTNWAEAAYDGLVSGSDTDDIDERHNCVRSLCKFISSFASRPEVNARISQESNGVLVFYIRLVQQALGLQWQNPVYQPAEAKHAPTPISSENNSHQLVNSVHQQLPAFISPASRTCADLCIPLYLDYLHVHMKTLAAVHLKVVLPVLFQALSFYATPLLHLQMGPAPLRKSTPKLEARLSGCLDALFQGPNTTSCMSALKISLMPPNEDVYNLPLHCQVAAGAQRMTRLITRRKIVSLAAEESIQKADPAWTSSSMHASQLMERALQKDDVAGWDLPRLCGITMHATKAWVRWFALRFEDDSLRPLIDPILEEAAETLSDILLEADKEKRSMDIDLSSVIGNTLEHLVDYILHFQAHGAPYIIPLRNPDIATTPFLRALANILARQYSVSIFPPMTATLLRMAKHLSDDVTAQVFCSMYEDHNLDLTSADWLHNWRTLLNNVELFTGIRPQTQRRIFEGLIAVYDSMKDMPHYRRPLADLVFQFCQKFLRDSLEGCNGDEIWCILGDEIFLRAIEAPIAVDRQVSPSDVEYMLILLDQVAMTADSEEDCEAVTELHFESGGQSSGLGAPPLNRMQSEISNHKDNGRSPSIVANFINTMTRRSQSQPAPQDHALVDDGEFAPSNPNLIIPAVGAVLALVSVFSQLAFTPYSASDSSAAIAIQVFETFVQVISQGKAAKARLAVLQFMMRLRADRDHRPYYVEADYDVDGSISNLAYLIHRHSKGTPQAEADLYVESAEDKDRRPRSRTTPRREDTRISRGRVSAQPQSSASRSRSRVGIKNPAPSPIKPRACIWRFPDTLQFVAAGHDTPSGILVSYKIKASQIQGLLPMSTYLIALHKLLFEESNWELVSYVLCHLPVQLANKHLFCGPKSREMIYKLSEMICTTVMNGTFSSKIERWPTGLGHRDAQSLAYHTLTVLISYQRCLDQGKKNLLVETFQRGLDSQLTTVACSLRALSLAAFELQPAMLRCLPGILTKLSQIMSKPDMAVHIISFIACIGSLPALHTNLNEDSFKMVFAVVLKYLQLHNQPDPSQPVPWAMSQYLRVISYYSLYVWFLAVKLPDRYAHVPLITRHLLIANQGRLEIDEPAEVCFDWLSRYTYASADPRPADSPLGQILFQNANEDLPQKSWILGNSIVTVRVLPKHGWVEWVSRRPSGSTKVLSRVENVPMVGLGDVDPDTVSVPAAILMHQGRDILRTHELDLTSEENVLNPDTVPSTIAGSGESNDVLPVPDPITGYVWSGSAPSQRRKQVEIDAAFLPLQMSSYPRFTGSPQNRIRVDTKDITSFIRSFDRMPVLDTHKIGVMYVAPGQSDETAILSNRHGSPAYTRFLEGLGRLIDLRGQKDVYEGGLNAQEDGNHTYAWWDDIGQVVFHIATMMPTTAEDPNCINKKRHLGNDHVQIVWNDSGSSYKFDTLKTAFSLINIVIEPHSLGKISAFSNNFHENEYFKVTIQRAPDVIDFTPVGNFKLISADNLPQFVRQLSLLTDWFGAVFIRTDRGRQKDEYQTNWIGRLQAIKQFRNRRQREADAINNEAAEAGGEGLLKEVVYRDFTASF